MEKGINLSLTKSLVDFDELLDRALEAVPGKNCRQFMIPTRIHGGNRAVSM
jgi:hypothetical protein